MVTLRGRGKQRAGHQDICLSTQVRGASPESRPLSHRCRLMSRPALGASCRECRWGPGTSKGTSWVQGGHCPVKARGKPSGLGLHLTGTQRRGRPWAPHTACPLLRSSGIPHLTKDGKDGLASTSLGLAGATTEVMDLILGSCEAKSTAGLWDWGQCPAGVGVLNTSLRLLQGTVCS